MVEWVKILGPNPVNYDLPNQQHPAQETLCVSCPSHTSLTLDMVLTKIAYAVPFT